MITGIVVALPEELSTLTSVKIAKGQSAFVNDKLVIAYSGAGAENSNRAAQLLIAQGAGQLISWGCAAAIAEGLQPGDLVLADVLMTADNQIIKTDANWHRAALTALSQLTAMQVGTLLESKHLVSASKQKRQLNQNTAAIALDMESIAIARCAQQHSLPFLVVRAIADPVAMDLPLAIEHSLNAAGDVDIGKLLLYLVRHPSETLGLIKLGLHFQAAKNTLKKVATQLDAIANFNATHHIA